MTDTPSSATHTSASASLPAAPVAPAARGTLLPLEAMPLERKVPLLVLALFTIVLALSLAVSYYDERRAAIAMAGERLVGLGQAVGTVIEGQMNARLVQLRRVARDTAVVNALQRPDHPLSSSAIHALSGLAIVPSDLAVTTTLVDSSGRAVGARRLDPPAEDANQIAAELARANAGGDSGHVTRLRMEDGHVSFYLAIPVRDTTGVLLGYLCQEQRTAITGHALPMLRGVVGADIGFFFRNADDQTWVSLDGTTAFAPRTMRRALDSLARYPRMGIIGDVLAATTPVRATALLVTVEQPMSVILARPRAVLRLRIIAFFLLAVLGAAAAWILSRRLVRPLGDLTRAVEGMASGRYTQRVEVERGDEIGRLGKTFNRMAEEIQASSETSNRAVARLTRSIETQEFLAEASRILSGAVSDDALLGNLANYCVPKLGDYCTIHVVDDRGAIRHTDTAHRDPMRLAALRRLVSHYAQNVTGPGTLSTVLRSRQPVLVPRLDLQEAICKATTPEAGRLLNEIAISGFMMVPLVARGRGFGAMTFGVVDGHRTLTDDDLEIAMELARRTSGAIDNAVIYRRSLDLRIEAEAASNAKSEFLAKMSHEIRTPINAMMGYAELLQLGLSGPITEAQAQQLARIRASGDHLTSLIGEILDLAKIEAGRLAVELSVAPVAEAIDGAMAIVRPLAVAKNVDMRASVAGDSSVVYFGDRQRVQQILTNLLSNAIKFTPSGGQVTVDASVCSRPTPSRIGSSDCVRVTIADTGLGIADEDHERIFHPFVQVEAGYTRSQGGTGLGLTISRNLAQLMGGEITVESALGAGSTFSLWVPCPAAAVASRG